MATELNPQVHKNIRVYGEVQGVFFRDSAKQKAESLGIRGFARNEPDGSVYIEAEGPDLALERLVLWCWEGPPSARVDRVTVEVGELRGLAGFEVR